MRAKRSRLLVIDASIANAAGEVNLASKYYRDILETILEVCHRIVMTPEIELEWENHQTRFALKWQRSMVAKKKVLRLGTVANPELRKKIELAATHQLAVQAGMISQRSLQQLDPASSHNQSREAMLKDTHLLEAALETDNIVISIDEIVRKLFAVATGQVVEIRNVIWINANGTDQSVLKWLEGGAKSEKKRRLVSQAPG
jgi:hypothetical protein